MGGSSVIRYSLGLGQADTSIAAEHSLRLDTYYGWALFTTGHSLRLVGTGHWIGSLHIGMFGLGLDLSFIHLSIAWDRLEFNHLDGWIRKIDTMGV